MRAEGDYRDRLYTIDKSGRRKWVYSHFLRGRFMRARTIVAYLLLVFYLAMPWLIINGKQGILLDIPHRRFIFFGLELWATDTIFLFLFLSVAGLALFFFTSILGRVWCGWACPETVFLEFLFRPIERLIEGSESERRKLDAESWTFKKIRKKLLKHAFSAAAAWVIASTALAYFIGRDPLLKMMSGSPLDNFGPFALTLAFMLVLAFQFGWFREQFCTILCPYARFQSVLMDRNSLLVGYDHNRGEPRGKLRTTENEHGDCIDCGLCVRVCPTGIDIRNGTQLECIACTACVDACDSVMTKISKPLGLIRYSTESELEGVKTKWLRPRVFFYAGILLILFSIFVYKISTRRLVDIEIVRTNQTEPFVLDSSNIVSNQFSLRVANKGEVTDRFFITPIHPDTLKVISPISQMEIQPGESHQVPVFLRVPLDAFYRGKAKIIIELGDLKGVKTRRELTLVGPAQ